MKEFITTPRSEEDDEADAIITKHNGHEVRFLMPTDGQFALLTTMSAEKMDPEQIGMFIQLFLGIMDEPTREYFVELLLDRKSGFTVDGEGGIQDIWESLAEEWSDRPSKQPSDYLPPQRVTGTKSMAATRAKARTSSASRSRASSR